MQELMQEIKPLVENLKAEKLKAEQERDVQEAKVSTLERQVAALYSRNEDLSGEVRYCSTYC